MSKKHCVLCRKPTTKKCRNCKIVYYCNKECQTQDWIHHKHICKKTLPEFCNAIYQMHLTNKCEDIMCTTGCLLNNDTHVFRDENNIRYKLRIRLYDLLYDALRDNKICILCGRDIIIYTCLNDLLMVDTKYDTKYHITTISYYRCISCMSKEITLCPDIFKTNLQCNQYYKSKILMIIFCLNNYQYILPEDIKYLLYKTCYLIKMCC